jgi:hypothetical protein
MWACVVYPFKGLYIQPEWVLRDIQYSFGRPTTLAMACKLERWYVLYT